MLLRKTIWVSIIFFFHMQIIFFILILKTAYLFFNGIGVKPNMEIAIHYAKLASKCGNFNSQYSLGIIFASNEYTFGEETNVELAAHYLQESIASGNTSSDPIRILEAFRDEGRIIVDESEKFFIEFP